MIGRTVNCSGMTNYTFIVETIMIYQFFFIKQKTAYEMRIIDWISDVCSSDLRSIGDRNYYNFMPPAAACRRRFRHIAEEPTPRARSYLRQQPWQHSIGRASCRDRVFQYVLISVFAV